MRKSSNEVNYALAPNKGKGEGQLRLAFFSAWSGLGLKAHFIPMSLSLHVSIGENHRFELREALLVYGDRQNHFVTRHQVQS